MKTQLKDNRLKQIESSLKEHIATRNLRDGVWRAFASQKGAFRDQLQIELYTQLETSSELSIDSIFSFLDATDGTERIVGKEQEN